MSTPVTPRHPRLGVRGEAMVLIALAWALMGVGVLTGTAPDISGRGLLHLVIPGEIRGLLWLTTAAVAFATCANRERSVYGIVALVVMPAWRLVSYAGSFFLWAVEQASPGWHLWAEPHAVHGYSGSWYNSIFYVLMVGFVLVAGRIPGGTAEPLTGPPDLQAVRDPKGDA